MKIVQRAEWGAKPAKATTRFRLPAAELWLHHLATDAWHGPAGMRAAQRFHQETRGWRDIAYGFCVDDDGIVYTGTGPFVVGSHTRGRNSIAASICFLGNFMDREPTEAALRSAGELVAHGAREGWWPAKITGGHRQAPGAQTACPGDRLFVKIGRINELAGSPPDDDDDTEARLLLWQ